MLGPDKALILTAVNINERRTRFLKSYKEDNGDWKLWEAILASSSAPIALPVWSRIDAGVKPPRRASTSRVVYAAASGAQLPDRFAAARQSEARPDPRGKRRVVE